jgi:signal transduction histidine kinase
MNSGILSRFVIFFTAITLLLALIGWTAHNSWERIGQLHEQLSETQWKSFQTADHLQQTILGLNNMVLRYAAYHNLVDWTNFCTTSRNLEQWINSQQPILSSQKEQPFLNQINTAFQDYMSAATTINNRIYTTGQSITRVVEFTDLEKQSKRILNLGFQLSETHQQSMDVLQTENIRSLEILRFALLGSLTMLLFAGSWLSYAVYRDMIRPLQVQLVESRQLAIRQEKLASLGMLAAGVAHEIRNPLTAIKAWLYLQKKRLTPGTPEYGDAELIGGEINRLERIVRDFLQFARPSEPKLTVVTAEQSLQEVQLLLGPELARSNIRLNLEDVQPAHIQIDPQQIKQVLINLIRNAAEAIGHDGTITLSTRLDSKRINDEQMDVVILEVTDTGKGIPPDAEKRLFDPFFSTKDTGTGLGLPIAARIIEKHHGALQYQTMADIGTTFGIILPRHNP